MYSQQISIYKHFFATYSHLLSLSNNNNNNNNVRWMCSLVIVIVHTYEFNINYVITSFNDSHIEVVHIEII